MSWNLLVWHRALESGVVIEVNLKILERRKFCDVIVLKSDMLFNLYVNFNNEADINGSDNETLDISTQY